MRHRHRIAALAGVVLVTATACGYRDDNDAAARRVTQAWLDAIGRRDAETFCRLMPFSEQVLIGKRHGGNCRLAAPALFAGAPPGLRAGATTVDLYPPTATAAVDVRGYGTVHLQRGGSVWFVIAAPSIHP